MSHSSASNSNTAQTMVWNKKGREKSSQLLSILPGDTGGYLETLKKGRARKREVPADSGGTSRLRLLGRNATKMQGSHGWGKTWRQEWKASFPGQSRLLAVTGLGLTLGRLTGVLGLVLGFLIKSLWSRGSRWYFIASMRKSLQVLLFFIKASSSTVWTR